MIGEDIDIKYFEDNLKTLLPKHLMNLCLTIKGLKKNFMVRIHKTFGDLISNNTTIKILTLS
jgi:hypothetical protein